MPRKTKTKDKLEELIDEEEELKDIKPEEDEFKDIKEEPEEDIEEDKDDLENIEEDENELEGIEEDEESKSISKQLKNISIKDPSGTRTKIMRSLPPKPSPVLEQIEETDSKQNLELELQETPMPETREEEEIDYSGQVKKENGLYGEGRKLEGTYDPHTRTQRFDESKASAFDSDKPREIDYASNGTDGTQEKGRRNDYEVKGANMKTKRFEPNASAFDSDTPREYEIE